MTLGTSRKQVPASVTKLPKLWPDWREGMTVLNFGCGKWPELTGSYLYKKHGALNVTHYDPNLVKHYLAHDDFDRVVGRYDVVIAANVLNVIRKCVLLRTLEQIKTVKASAYIFQIYEGDRTAGGKDTRDGYQRNARAKDYIPDIYQVFMPRHLDIKGNTIVVTM